MEAAVSELREEVGTVTKRTCQVENNTLVFAAIYARTSSPNQRFNYSLKEQVNLGWKFCKDRGWVVRYVFVDECESGGTIDRPKFQLLLEKAKARRFNVIVFWKLDRFCRSLVDLINIEKILREWGISICSVTEYIDTTTSVGRFNFRSLASVGEFERELIGERARIGLYALAKEHRWPNSHPPLGYTQKDDGKLVIDTDEAKLVQKIFKMYIAEKCMPQVAFLLNKQDLHTKKGSLWNARAVHDVLTNEAYVGRYKVAGVNDFVKEYRILDDKIFAEVSEIRSRYRTSGAKRLAMPEDRKEAMLDKIFNEFLKALREEEDSASNGLEFGGFQHPPIRLQ